MKITIEIFASAKVEKETSYSITQTHFSSEDGLSIPTDDLQRVAKEFVNLVRVAKEDFHREVTDISDEKSQLNWFEL